jgi:hypothetical protein
MLFSCHDDEVTQGAYGLDESVGDEANEPEALPLGHSDIVTESPPPQYRDDIDLHDKALYEATDDLIIQRVQDRFADAAAVSHVFVTGAVARMPSDGEDAKNFANIVTDYTFVTIELVAGPDPGIQSYTAFGGELNGVTEYHSEEIDLDIGRHYLMVFGYESGAGAHYVSDITLVLENGDLPLGNQVLISSEDVKAMIEAEVN